MKGEKRIEEKEIQEEKNRIRGQRQTFGSCRRCKPGHLRKSEQTKY